MGVVVGISNEPFEPSTRAKAPGWAFMLQIDPLW
jgi:hypothetical protein